MAHYSPLPSLPWYQPCSALSQMDPLHTLNLLDNIRVAFNTLHERVLRALQTQVGDSARLQQTRTQVQSLLQAAELVSGHLYLVI